MMIGTPRHAITMLARAIGIALAVPTLVLLAYGGAGLIGGAIPVNAAWRPPTTGVRVFVESNGVHVGIVVPKVAAGVDWRGIMPARDLADPRYGGFDHLAIGWGEQAFFLGTPSWSDARPGPILHAALGSDATLLHVEHIPAPSFPAPATSNDVRAITLRPAEYRRLAAFLRASLVPGGRRYPGYARYDVFYQARGRYDAIHDCNAWIGRALRVAGVRVGWWTPLPVTVMAWFS